MARDMSTDRPAGRGRLIRNLWGSIAQRWPRRLRLHRPRLTRLRLAVLAGVAVLVFLWGAAAVASTTTYSAQIVVVGVDQPVGLAPPVGQLDFGDLPPGIASEKSIMFENSGRVPTAVMILEWGGIRDLLQVGDAFFTLDPGGKKEVVFKVEPPPSAVSGEAKEYSGRVIVIRAPWWWP